MFDTSSFYTLYDYLIEQHILIKSNLKKVKNRFKNDHMHDYRVAVKRFRAIDRFLQYLFDRETHKEYKKQLKHNFRHVGAVRDTRLKREWEKQIQKEAGNKSSLKILKMALKKEEKQKQDNFLKLAAKIRKKSFNAYIEDINKAYSNLPNNAIEKKLELYCNLTELEIDRISKNPEISKWHEARKFIKTLSYLGEWVMNSPHNHIMEQYDFDKMKQLTNVLGDWHDSLLMYEYLQTNTALKVKEMKMLTINLEAGMKKLESQVDWNYKK
ncbi:MAG: CHAD domain-containing protein [Bacteroidota bacterium]